MLIPVLFLENDEGHVRENKGIIRTSDISLCTIKEGRLFIILNDKEYILTKVMDDEVGFYKEDPEEMLEIISNSVEEEKKPLDLSNVPLGIVEIHYDEKNFHTIVKNDGIYLRERKENDGKRRFFGPYPKGSIFRIKDNPDAIKVETFNEGEDNEN